MDPAGGVCCDCREEQQSSTCCRVGLLRRGTRIRRRADDADHISSLPDDLLLQILARVGCARAAAHTGLVSRRWRGLWTRLPELDFHHICPDRLLAALDRVARPAGSVSISIPWYHSLSPAWISSMLRVVALLAPAKLAVDVDADDADDADVVELPCFDRTTSLELSFASSLTLPPVGDFKALESLSLRSCNIDLGTLLSRCSLLRKLHIRGKFDLLTVHSPSLEELHVCAAVQLQHVDIVAPVRELKFHAIDGVRKMHSFSFSGDFTALESLFLGACHTDLGDLLPRCPRLRKLKISYWKLDSLTVHSQSLEELDVYAVPQLVHVDIVVPVLKTLMFDVYRGINKECSFSFSAPQLKDVSWHCPSRSATDRFGVIWHMYSLTLSTLESTGNTQLTDSKKNTCSLMPDIPGHMNFGAADQSFGQEISRIPTRKFTILELDIGTGGHVYGAMVLDLLGLCTFIQNLKVTLHQVNKPCSTNCSCDQPNNWRSQIISLNDLKEVEIEDFNGEEHGVALLKVLLRCAEMLDRVTVKLSRDVPQSCSAHMEFPGILKAHPSVKFSVYRWCGDQVLFN
ncbi:hypothetical protein EJB05_12652, partial [Eragrostis curvula]